MLLSAIGAMVLTSSCKKDFFTEANENPNAPDSVTPGSLLSTVLGSISYTQGGDLSRYASMFTQQTIGVARQAEGWYSYIFTSQDVDNMWGNFYTQALENDELLIEQADAKGYHTYSGVARICLGYTLMLVVDAWGDVPYTEAFKGRDNLHPAFDNAAALYDSIGNLIDAGIDHLNNADAGILVPGADDFIYGGDASLWIKFGHAIKARLAIHQSKDNSQKAQEALDEMVQSFTSNNDNARMPFGAISTNASPWYQFNTQRGDISFAQSTLAGTLTSLSDPRYPVYIDDVNDVDGLGLAAYYGSINSPVEFITYDEMKFVQAEAILRTTGDINSAQQAYQDAITANMEKLGISSDQIATYIANNGTLPTNVDDAIAQVALQEWIALYLNPEEWTTYRRTESPSLVPVDGSEVPRRILYPQTEYSYNAEHVPASTLYTPLIFWDN